MAPTGTYTTRDGHFIVIGANGDSIFKRFMTAIGRADLAESPRFESCDTTGMANPRQVARLAGAVRERWPELEVALHFHNTRGAGLANLLGGLEAGVTVYEASIGGTGGCPFAPKATGNICTEDTVHMLHDMGIQTGLNLERLIEAALLMEQTLGRELPGQVMKAGPRSRRFAPNGPACG